MIERTPTTCSAAGCIRPAVDVGYRGGRLLWAVCEAHLSAVRPMFEHEGGKVTVAGKMLLTAIEASLGFGTAMSFSNPQIARDVLEALFSAPGMRGMVLTYLEEIDGE